MGYSVLTIYLMKIISYVDIYFFFIFPQKQVVVIQKKCLIKDLTSELLINRGIHIKFLYFLMKMYVVVLIKKSINEALLMSPRNMCLWWNTGNINYFLLKKPLSPAVFCRPSSVFWGLTTASVLNLPVTKLPFSQLILLWSSWVLIITFWNCFLIILRSLPLK